MVHPGIFEAFAFFGSTFALSSNSNFPGRTVEFKLSIYVSKITLSSEFVERIKVGEGLQELFLNNLMIFCCNIQINKASFLIQ